MSIFGIFCPDKPGPLFLAYVWDPIFWRTATHQIWLKMLGIMFNETQTLDLLCVHIKLKFISFQFVFRILCKMKAREEWRS